MYTSTMQTKFGSKVHAVQGQFGKYSMCDLLFQNGDHLLSSRRKVTCKKCQRILARLQEGKPKSTALLPTEFGKRDAELVSGIVSDILQERRTGTQELASFSWSIEVDYTFEQESN